MLNAQHLLELARKIVSALGKPRQVDLRRAVSTVYYAVFHSLATGVAKQFGATDWKTQVLFYRALDHRRAKERCNRLKNPLPAAERKHFDSAVIGNDIQSFASLFVTLQELRHEADYDPDAAFLKAEAQEAIDSAELAVAHLESIGRTESGRFLAYILLGIRTA
jgi:uncharacterized protein (UPF0332 family)